MRFECVSRTHVGLRRKINEDSVLALPEMGLWAVADGMGGHEAGEVASAKVVEVLANLPVDGSIDRLVTAAIAALEDANGALIDLAHANHMPRTIGSTVVALAIADGQFRCFWAGDSRAYHVRGDRMVQLTRDHSMVQDLVDAGMLSADEAESHPNANVITRAVGAAEKLLVDTVDGQVLPGDQFLLASDGLTRVVEADELLDHLADWPPTQAADKLIDLVLARGAPDNVSLIIAKVA